jgi:hypothetical protein
MPPDVTTNGNPQTLPTPHRRRRRPVGDPALLARHSAALRLLRKGIETDGALLLSYVVWPNLEPRAKD